MEYRLIECCEFIDYRGKTPEKSDDGYRLITAKNVKPNGYSDEPKEYIPKESYESVMVRGIPRTGDILFTTEAPLGNVCRIPTFTEPFAVGQRLIVMQPNPRLLDYQYMVYKLRSSRVQEEIFKHSSGSTVRGIRSKELAEIEIEFPELDEQKLISNELMALEKIIELRTQELDTLDNLIKARFVELMNQYSANNCLKEFISSYKAERCGDRDIPVLSITKEDGIVFQSEKFKKRIASVNASTYKVVPRGKLVQGIHIDERNFAIQNIVEEGIVSPAYKIWNVDESKAIPEVLAFAMRTDRTMAYISSKFTGSVKRRESISIDDFMVTPIDLPEMSVQTEFYEFLKQVDKSKVVDY